MRIYLNCKDAIKDVGRELNKCSTKVHTATYQNKEIKDDPNFETKELQGFEFAIINTRDKDSMPNVTLEWARAEFAERISKESINPGEAYKLRPKVWEQFLVEREPHREGEKKAFVFDYTYNQRISFQLPSIINELRLHPNTRQAIIEIHNNQFDLNSLGIKRIPCSMFYHFMIRDNKLDVLYIMRSSDFATHFQNDLWLAAELRDYIAENIGVERGKLIMFISSLHIYKKDWELLKNY